MTKSKAAIVVAISFGVHGLNTASCSIVKTNSGYAGRQVDSEKVELILTFAAINGCEIGFNEISIE